MGSGAQRRSRAAKKTPVPRQEPIGVLVVDDHPMWRQTLRKVVERSRVGKVIAEADNGDDAVRKAHEHRPHVVVMDIGLPNMNGIEATRRILEASPDTRVLVLSASEDRADVVAAIRAGAGGYLPKTAEPNELSEAVRRLAKGELVLPPALADIVLDELRRGDSVPTLRVVLADASALFRDGLDRMLSDHGFEVVAKARNAEELFALVGSESPDVVVTDARLSPEIAQDLTRAHPAVGVLLLSAEIDVRGGLAAADASTGIGYLLKDRVTDAAQLADAIRRVARGESVLDAEVAAQLVQPRKQRNPLDALTPREREVLALMAEGRSNQGIADRLFLSGKAVEGHVRNIYGKLNLEPAADDSRRVLAVFAFLRSF